MSKPDLTVIEGGKVQLVEIPERVEFVCHACAVLCVMYPRSKPISVQHGLPTCNDWKRIEGKKDDLERFLIKAGMEVHVPNPDPFTIEITKG